MWCLSCSFLLSFNWNTIQEIIYYFFPMSKLRNLCTSMSDVFFFLSIFVSTLLLLHKCSNRYITLRLSFFSWSWKTKKNLFKWGKCFFTLKQAHLEIELPLPVKARSIFGAPAGVVELTDILVTTTHENKQWPGAREMAKCLIHQPPISQWHIGVM